MQDREFTMTKSLLTVLVGRTRSNDGANLPSKGKAAKAAAAAFEAHTSKSGRRHRFDDKSGPPPPRGSLTSEKLSYLDWRLKRINNVRHKSEGTAYCWIDGRDTIGRTSFDCDRPRTADVSQTQHKVAPAPVLPPVQAIAPLPAMYAEEKAAGLKALEHAYAGDSVLAGMPHLAKRDSSSTSETSGSSDQHHASHAPAQLHATADKDVGAYFTKPRRSLLVRAGSRFGKKKSSAVRNTEGEEQDATVSRSNHSLSRIWNR